MAGMVVGHDALNAALHTNINTVASEANASRERVTVTVITFARRKRGHCPRRRWAGPNSLLQSCRSPTAVLGADSDMEFAAGSALRIANSQPDGEQQMMTTIGVHLLTCATGVLKPPVAQVTFVPPRKRN
jgi:hypothetical protein